MKNLFNFVAFKNQLLESNEKSDLIMDYENLYEQFTEDFKDSFIYKSYINKFIIPKNFIDQLNISQDTIEYFDVELLIQLIFASFSSTYRFQSNPNGKLDLLIEVLNRTTFEYQDENENMTFKDYLYLYHKKASDFENLLSNQVHDMDEILQKGVKYNIVLCVIKTLPELWSFQVTKLFQIYIEEEIQLFCLIESEPQNAEPICNQQQLRYELFKVKYQEAKLSIEKFRTLDL